MISSASTRSLLQTFGGVLLLRESIALPAVCFKGRVVQLQHTVTRGRGRALAARSSSSMSDDGAKSAAASGPGSKAVNVVIKGTVQGVFYRKWTVSTAQKLGLNGWVRNCRDGSVEAVFQGPASTVDTMVQQCGSGPPAARVMVVDVSQWDNQVPQGFEQTATW